MEDNLESWRYALEGRKREIVRETSDPAKSRGPIGK